MTQFEQFLIEKLAEIEVRLEYIDVNTDNSFKAIHDLYCYLNKSCPNKFDIFDNRCLSCPYGDVCQRDEE